MSDDRAPNSRTPIDRLIRVGFNPPTADNKSAVDRLRAALGAEPSPKSNEDRYEIGESIGRGGVGAVYRGRDHNLDREVAIKVLAEEHAHNRDLADRFVDEARIAGRLEHPEQARGDVTAIDRRTDVFALGALLCEILTGQPPYVGSQSDVRRQARDGDLTAAYARIAEADLEPDLFAVLRGALVADPDSRLADAQALAARFNGYREARDARLREAELNAARARVRLGLFVAVAALLATVALTWWWFDRDRTRQANDARDRVTESAAELRDLHAAARGTLDSSLWTAVEAGVERTRRSLESDHLDRGFREGTAKWLEQLDGETTDANARIRRAARDRAMVSALDRVRLSATEERTGRPDIAYRDAFNTYGIDVDRIEAKDAAERIRESAIREPLIAALDGWTMIEQRADFDRAKRMFEIVRLADPDPLRHRVRVALLEGDHDAVRDVAKSLDPKVEPAETVIAVGHRLIRIGENEAAHALLVEALNLRPGAFWIHEQLSRLALHGDPDPTLALCHCEAMRALRPHLVSVWLRLAAARRADDDRPGAEAAIRRALEIDPRSAAAHFDFGEFAMNGGDRPAAIASIRTAIDIDDRSPFWHYTLGELLRDKGDPDGARAAYQATVERMPNHLQALEKLGGLALRERDFELADDWMAKLLEAGRKVVDRRASVTEIHRRFGYDPGRSLGFAAFHLAERASGRGDVTESMALYRESSKWFPVNQIAAGKLATMLIAIGEFKQAETVARESIERQKEFPLAQAALGQSLEKQGKYDEAHAIYEKTIEGVKRIGVRSNAPTVMLRHVAKKREKIPDLDALIRGGEPPEDGAELMLLGEIAIDRGEVVSGAKLYRLALSASLDRVARQTAQLQGGVAAFRAAEITTGTERTDWRSDGLEWLNALLQTWKPLLEGRHAGTIRTRVANLEIDRRLASVRGERLEALDAKERERFDRFWQLVGSFAERH